MADNNRDNQPPEVFDAEEFQREFEGSYGNKIPYPLPMKPASSQSLIIPAAQALETVYEGEVAPERYLIQRRYKTGAHSIIYRAEDQETGGIVAIKKHLHYMPETDDPEAIRSAGERFKREVQVLAKLNHQGIVRPYGFYLKEEDGVQVPHLVTELIETDSLEEKLARGEVFDEDDASRLVLSVGTILDYLHTINAKPIIYRDLKPDNIKVMPEEASWPNKLVDFSESRIGESTMSGSVIGTIGYNAPELYGGRIANPTADFYSLLRVATHLLIGDSKKFMRNYFGGLSLEELRDSGDLRVSDDFFRVIQKATYQYSEERYENFLEIARDLGYEIERTPQTREELEAILRGNSLSVQVQEPEPQAQTPEVPEVRTEKSSLTVKTYEVKLDTGGETLIIDGFRIPKGRDIYETARNVYNHIGERFVPDHKDALGRNGQLLWAYLQHAAKDNPILQDALAGRRSVEGAVRETRKSKKYEPFYQRELELQKVLGGINILVPSEAYKRRVTELQEVLSDANKTSGVGGGIGFAGGYISSIFSLIHMDFLSRVSDLEGVLWILGNWALGGVAGSSVGKSINKRKLCSKARELDGWIHQARVSAGLEEKVEDVSLTEDEKEEINKKENKIAASTWGLSTLVGAITGGILLDPEEGIINGSIAGSIIGLYWGTVPTIFSLAISEHILPKLALRHKRQSLGIEAKVKKPEMREFPSVILSSTASQLLNEALLEAGLRKKRFSGKYVGDGVEVRCKDREIEVPGMSPYDGSTFEKVGFDITLKATSEEKTKPVYDAIKAKFSGDVFRLWKIKNDETPQLNLSGDNDSFPATRPLTYEEIQKMEDDRARAMYNPESIL